MEITWAFAADQHFKSVEPFGQIDPETRMNTRTTKKLELLAEFLDTPGMNFYVLAGDLFDEGNPSQKVRRAVVDVIQKAIFEDHKSVFMVPGNHDHSGEVGALESEGLLSRKLDSGEVFTDALLQGFYYIDKPLSITIRQCRFLFVPYQCKNQIIEYGESDAMLSRHETPDVLFSHFYVEGSAVSKTNLSKVIKGKGYPFHNLRPFPLVQLGDIHTTQRLDNGKFGVYYPGLMNRIAIDDDVLTPGFLVTTLEATGKSIKYVVVKRHELDDWKIKRLLFSEEDNPEMDTLPDIIADVASVVFEGSQEWLDGLPYSSFRRQALEMGIKKYLWSRKRLDGPDDEVKEKAIEGTLVERWVNYAKQHNLDPVMVKMVVEKLNV